MLLLTRENLKFEFDFFLFFGKMNVFVKMNLCRESTVQCLFLRTPDFLLPELLLLPGLDREHLLHLPPLSLKVLQDLKFEILKNPHGHFPTSRGSNFKFKFFTF